MFRAADPGTPPRRIGPTVRFRCVTCGGQGMIDELQRFSVENAAGCEDEDEDEAEDEDEFEVAPPAVGAAPELRLVK